MDQYNPDVYYPSAGFLLPGIDILDGSTVKDVKSAGEGYVAVSTENGTLYVFGVYDRVFVDNPQPLNAVTA